MLDNKILDIALTMFLFGTSCFGMVIGVLWALGYVEMWMVPRW